MYVLQLNNEEKLRYCGARILVTCLKTSEEHWESFKIWSFSVGQTDISNSLIGEHSIIGEDGNAFRTTLGRGIDGKYWLLRDSMIVPLAKMSRNLGENFLMQYNLYSFEIKLLIYECYLLSHS